METIGKIRRRHLINGESISAIARSLNLSRNTVKKHLSTSLLRQFIPKGTDLRTVSEEDLQRYQGALNSRPRKCLGFRQPSVVFAELRKAA